MILLNNIVPDLVICFRESNFSHRRVIQPSLTANIQLVATPFRAFHTKLNKMSLLSMWKNLFSPGKTEFIIRFVQK